MIVDIPTESLVTKDFLSETIHSLTYKFPREEIILAINIASQHLAHLPEICIWQRKTNAKMGSEAALISLLSGTRGHENRSSHVNKH